MKAKIAVATAIYNCLLVILATMVLMGSGLAAAQTDRQPTTPTYTAWGSQSFEIEKEIYDAEVSRTEKLRDKAKMRYDQEDRLRTAKVDDWESEDIRGFELWAQTQPGYSPAARSDSMRTKQDFDEANRRYRRAAAGLEHIDPRDQMVGGAFRQQVWPSHLAQLQAEAAYYDAQAWFVQNQNALLQMYIQSMFSTYVDQVGEHLQYILRRHAVSFWKDLTDCATKTLTLALGERLLKKVPGIDPEGYLGWSRVPGIAAPDGELTSELTPDLVERQQTRALSDRQSTIFSCLADTTRASLVNATANSMRFSFVKGTARDYDVPEEIAEYWWVRLINPKDDERSAWEPRTLALPFEDVGSSTWAGRSRLLGEALLDASKETFLRYADASMMLEIAKDTTKARLEQAIRKRVHEGAAKYAFGWFKAEIKKPQGRSIQWIRDEAAEKMQQKGRELVNNDVSLMFVQGVDWAEVPVQIVAQAWSVSSKKAGFDQVAKQMAKEYHTIYDCLQKQGMARHPAAVLAIYKMRKDIFDEFLDQCKKPDILGKAQGIARNIWLILEEVRKAAALGNAQCEEAKGSARAASSSLARFTPESALGTGHTDRDIQELAIGVNLDKARASGRSIYEDSAATGKAKVDAESKALMACQAYLDGHKAANVETRQNMLRVARTFADEAAASRTEAATHLTSLNGRLAELQALVRSVTAAADSVSVRPSAGTEPGDPESRLQEGRAAIEKARGLLATSREATHLSIPMGKAKRLQDELEQVLKPIMENPTAVRLRDDTQSWVAEMESLVNAVESCQSSAQAAIDEATGVLTEAEARFAQTTPTITPAGIPAGDLTAQRQEAEFILADAQSQGELAAEYDSAAEAARQNAEKCVDLLRSDNETSVQRDAPSPADAQPDCNTIYPGSRATYVPSMNATLCLCPDGRRADQKGGCGTVPDPRCAEMTNRLNGAHDSATAQAVLNEAQALGCPVSESAINSWNRRHALQCEVYAQRLWATHDLNAARAIVQEATALGCNLQRTVDAWDNRRQQEAVQRNQQQQQQMQNIIQGIGQTVQGITGGRSVPSAAPPPARTGTGAPPHSAASPPQTRPPASVPPTRHCQKVCVQSEVQWFNITDGRHGLCAGGVPRSPGRGLPPPKCERSVKCLKWETRCP